ncbi:MAG: hypothetical protein IKG27_03840 [Bacilli bacterium]|nr:hypothetical protein [Bacilli bacterium]
MKIKDVILTFILLIFVIFVYVCREDIAKTAVQTYMHFETLNTPKSNVYSDSFTFELVQKTDDFHVKDYQGLLDTIYTILDSGASEFSFYCDSSYNKCMDDFENLSKNQALLSTINNMISPYNSYAKISFSYNSYGKITLSVDKLYSDEEIKLIENKIDDFMNKNIKDEMIITDKIKAFHDYLINNSVYDKARADIIESGNNVTDSNSHKAIGPLIDGISLCSGYSDAMKIYLDKLHVSNYKVANDKHIWNLVNVDNKWLHIDLTWDDPVTNTGQNLLLHKFFLIDTNTLLKLDSTSHNFNKDYYPELSH